jgi:hypothetical protein
MPSQSAFSERRPYEPRSAESALLYGIVSAELDGFLDDASEPVLAAFVRAVFASLRRRARDRLGVQRAKPGAVTFVQRFGGALNLNVHFHSLVFDGVYEVLPGLRGVRFARLPAPDTEEWFGYWRMQ